MYKALLGLSGFVEGVFWLEKKIFYMNYCDLNSAKRMLISNLYHLTVFKLPTPKKPILLILQPKPQSL